MYINRFSPESLQSEPISALMMELYFRGYKRGETLPVRGREEMTAAINIEPQTSAVMEEVERRFNKLKQNETATLRNFGNFFRVLALSLRS